MFNISSGVSEIRLASLGFLGHGVFRVEAAAEGIDYAQVEVKGAHGRVCVLKDAADEVMGVGLVVRLSPYFQELGADCCLSKRGICMDAGAAKEAEDGGTVGATRSVQWLLRMDTFLRLIPKTKTSSSRTSQATTLMPRPTLLLLPTIPSPTTLQAVNCPRPHHLPQAVASPRHRMATSLIRLRLPDLAHTRTRTTPTP